jgi:hypothetical protein
MGRAGRYTLSVMAWVAAYAGWSSLVGLVIAAVTGDRPRSVSPAASAVFTVVGPVVPTLVALWFNDWARDGFPTREQRAARAAAAPPRSVQITTLEHVEPAAENEPPAAEPVPEPAAAGYPVAPLLRDRLDLDGGH